MYACVFVICVIHDTVFAGYRLPNVSIIMGSVMVVGDDNYDAVRIRSSPPPTINVLMPTFIHVSLSACCFFFPLPSTIRIRYGCLFYAIGVASLNNRSYLPACYPAFVVQ